MDYKKKNMEKLDEKIRNLLLEAEQGSASAQNELGDCYFDGKGVIQDYVEAVKWYKLAVDKENSDAQNNLGYCYYYGKGVIQDYAEAVTKTMQKP